MLLRSVLTCELCHISPPQHYSPTVRHKTWKDLWSQHQRISRISSRVSLSTEFLMKWCQSWTSYRPYVEAGLAWVANWRVRLSFFSSQWVGSKAYSGSLQKSSSKMSSRVLPALNTKHICHSDGRLWHVKRTDMSHMPAMKIDWKYNSSVRRITVTVNRLICSGLSNYQ